MIASPFYHENASKTKSEQLSMEAKHNIKKDEGQMFDISAIPDSKRLMKKVIKPGKIGATLPKGDCKLHYTGYVNGKQFETSRWTKAPSTFTISGGTLMPAWEIALPTMQAGELCELTCAPEYCYGETGCPPDIPPNSTLVFEIEMISWQKAPLITPLQWIALAGLICVVAYILLTEDFRKPQRREGYPDVD